MGSFIIPGYGLQLTLLSREDSNRWSTYRAKSTTVCYQTNVQRAPRAVRWSVLRETSTCWVNPLPVHKMFAASSARGRRNSELMQKEIEQGRELIKRTEANNIAGVKELLEAGASVNAVEYVRFLFYKSQNYFTPLQIAAQKGYEELVRLLIEYKADLSACDRFDTTAMHLAADRGHLTCLQLLIEAGASTTCAIKSQKHNSYSSSLTGYCTCPPSADPHKEYINALSRLQSMEEQLRCPRCHCKFPLLSSERPIKPPPKKRKYETRYQMQFTELIDYVGGTTPLHLATRHRHVECVRELIMNGADYNAVDETGKTSMYIAAELGYSDVVLTHLRNAIGRDILSLPVFLTGETPLHECVRHNMRDCVEELLRHGSDVNHLNAYGASPLHLALQNSDKFSLKMVNTLVTKGYAVDVNKPDCTGTCNCASVGIWVDNTHYGGCGFRPLQYVTFPDTPKHERRPLAAALLIAHGAQFDHLINKHGQTLWQYEFAHHSPDKTILQAMVKTMAVLPSLEVINVAGHCHMGQGAGTHGRPPGAAAPANGIGNQNVLDKIDWYKHLLAAPRTLQHYARCIIRGSLGTNRLRRISDLPLPEPLKDYLLLEYDEYR